MSWEKEKAILLLIGVLLFGLMCFILGIALGASSNQTEFSGTILPLLSVVGTWVSGLGALGAVIVALWLAEKHRRAESELLELDLGFVIIPFTSEAVLMISAVSKGKRPSEINSISIYGKKANSKMYLANFLRGGNQLPVNIGYGKKASFFCEVGFEYKIGEYISANCNGSAKELVLCVSTTTENFLYSPDTSMKKALETFAVKSKSMLESSNG
jgi:vacuolar-type H+-ATPase subunit I/STV1